MRVFAASSGSTDDAVRCESGSAVGGGCCEQAVEGVSLGGAT
jgi:hypothetical protein